MCSAVVDAFALKLTRKEHDVLRQDVPATPEAYEHYLRANRLSTTASTWPLARDLYRRAVEADPSYAPAWARLGRVAAQHRQVRPHPGSRRRNISAAEEAFQRAFALNPDLPLAHNLYTYMEVETGRALGAMTAAARPSADAHQRSGPLCRAGAGLPLRRPARRVGRRLPSRDAARPRDRHQRRPFLFHARAVSARDRSRFRSAAVHLGRPRIIALRSVRRSARRCATRPRRRPAVHPHVELMVQVFEAMLTGRFERGTDGAGRADGLSRLQRSGRLVLLGTGRRGRSKTTMSRWNCSPGRSPPGSPVRARSNPRRCSTTCAAPPSSRGCSRVAREGHEAARRAFAQADGHRLLGLPRA